MGMNWCRDADSLNHLIPCESYESLSAETSFNTSSLKCGELTDQHDVTNCYTLLLEVDVSFILRPCEVFEDKYQWTLALVLTIWVSTVIDL